MATYNLLFKNLEELKIKGVGKTNISKFNKLGVFTLHDLLYFFPRAYEDRTNSKNIVNLLQDEFAAVRGVIINVTTQYIKAGRTMFKAILKDDTGIMELVWFNNRYIKSYIKIGDELLVYGKVKKSVKFQMVNPEYKRLDENGLVKGKSSEQNK